MLSDSAALDNEMHTNSYVFTGRLLAYLAGRHASSQDVWRQLLGLLSVGLLVGLLAWQPAPLRIGGTCVVLTVSLAACTAVTSSSARVLPGTPSKRGLYRRVPLGGLPRQLVVAVSAWPAFRGP